MLAVQEQLASLRVNQSRPPYLQTTSTMVCIHMYTCTCVIATYMPVLYSWISPSLKSGYLMSVHIGLYLGKYAL